MSFWEWNLIWWKISWSKGKSFIKWACLGANVDGSCNCFFCLLDISMFADIYGWERSQIISHVFREFSLPNTPIESTGMVGLKGTTFAMLDVVNTIATMVSQHWRNSERHWFCCYNSPKKCIGWLSFQPFRRVCGIRNNYPVLYIIFWYCLIHEGESGWRIFHGLDKYVACDQPIGRSQLRMMEDLTFPLCVWNGLFFIFSPGAQLFFLGRVPRFGHHVWPYMPWNVYSKNYET